MDYGSGGLWVLAFWLLMIIIPIWKSDGDYGGKYQFDVKDTIAHEQQQIRSESFIWMDQGK